MATIDRVAAHKGWPSCERGFSVHAYSYSEDNSIALEV